MKFGLFISLPVFLIASLTNSLAQDDTIKNYHQNGAIASLVPMYKGLREGKTLFFSPIGALSKEMTYKTGKAEGIVTEFYPNGKIKEQYNLENGKRQGPSQYFDSLGVLKNTLFFELGRLKVVVPDLEVTEKSDLSDTTLIVDSIFEFKGYKKDISQLMQVMPGIKRIDPPGVDPAYFSTPDVFAAPKFGYAKFIQSILYPSKARREEIEGEVEILVYIDYKGEIFTTDVLKRVGGGCTENVEMALKYTEFLPAYIEDKPVNSKLLIKVPFVLKEE